MNNYTSVIEIKNKSLRLLVGYILNDSIKVIYTNEIELSIPFNLGDIIDVGSLSKDLLKLTHVEDQDLNLRMNINEAIVVIPSFGLEIYESTKTTTTVSNDFHISKLDINNVIALIERERLDNTNNSIVNIIPNNFITDSGESYLNSPLDIKSNYLTLNANVYVLPTKILQDVKKAFKNASIHIKNIFVSALCGVEVLKRRNFKFKDYIYINYGERNTFLHLINNSKVVASTYFNNGSDSLVKRVSEEYKISESEALRFIRLFGYDDSINTYNPSLINKVDNGYNESFNRTSLNTTVSAYYKDLGEYLSSSMRVLLQGHDSMISQIPLVFVGKGFKIKGLKEYINRLFNNNINFVNSDVVGIDFNSFINLAGAIYLDDLSLKLYNPEPNRVEIKTLKEGD